MAFILATMVNTNALELRFSLVKLKASSNCNCSVREIKQKLGLNQCKSVEEVCLSLLCFVLHVRRSCTAKLMVWSLTKTLHFQLLSCILPQIQVALDKSVKSV